MFLNEARAAELVDVEAPEVVVYEDVGSATSLTSYPPSTTFKKEKKNETLVKQGCLSGNFRALACPKQTFL